MKICMYIYPPPCPPPSLCDCGVQGGRAMVYDSAFIGDLMAEAAANGDDALAKK